MMSTRSDAVDRLAFVDVRMRPSYAATDYRRAAARAARIAYVLWWCGDHEGAHVWADHAHVLAGVDRYQATHDPF